MLNKPDKGLLILRVFGGKWITFRQVQFVWFWHLIILMSLIIFVIMISLSNLSIFDFTQII